MAFTTATGFSISRSMRDCATGRRIAVKLGASSASTPTARWSARGGRPVDVKWRNLLLDMAPGLLRAVPDVQTALRRR